MSVTVFLYVYEYVFQQSQSALTAAVEAENQVIGPNSLQVNKNEMRSYWSRDFSIASAISW